jgi:hypothetical protein
MYATPVMTALGSVADMTRGDCGWGTENVYLDKTGFVQRTAMCQNTVCNPGCVINYYECTVCVHA